MLYYNIIPKSFPKIRFAHYFTKKDYTQKYTASIPLIELVYIKNGYATFEITGQKHHLPQGSFLIFCRKHVPAIFSAEPNATHIHYTCAIELDYECNITDNTSEPIHKNENSLFLPLVLPPSDEATTLSKKLARIITEHNADNYNSADSSIALLGLLGDISQLCKKTIYEQKDASRSILCYKIKKYISSNIYKTISLSDVAKAIGKSPNHLNSVFKKNEGISICQYINREKINMITELKKTRDITFEDACICLGILDISYGYRLFKKHMGMTPKTYFENMLET